MTHPLNRILAMSSHLALFLGLIDEGVEVLADSARPLNNLSCIPSLAYSPYFAGSTFVNLSVESKSISTSGPLD